MNVLLSASSEDNACASVRYSKTKPKHNFERGAVAIEGAFAISFFLIFAVAACELIRLCYAQLTMQYILTRAAREISIADAPDANTAVTLLSKHFSNFGFTFQPRHDLNGNPVAGNFEVTICPLDKLDTPVCGPGTILLGGPAATQAYRLRYYGTSISPTFQFLQLARRDITLTSILVTQNEPR